MQQVPTDDVDPTAMGSDIDRRGLSDPLGTSDPSINRYHLEPGEGFSGGMHAHIDQEEVFNVVECEATFETMDGAVTVGPDEAVRFAPGEFQTGSNESDDALLAIAPGAPRDSQDVHVPQDCPDCDQENMRAMPAGDDEGFTLVCPECGAEVDA